jgi:hypothetical protein
VVYGTRSYSGPDGGRLGGSVYNQAGLIENDMLHEEISAMLNRDPWTEAPAERDPRYFQTWQRVSLAIQKRLRTSIPDFYFRDRVELYEDRESANHMVVYEACRLYYGRPKTEFTYDVADPETLPRACRTIGRAMQTVLGRIEKRLQESGRAELGRRYKPVWHQDILRAALKKPKPLVQLLANESLLIDAVIDLGTSRSAASVNRLIRAEGIALRRVFGTDMRDLGANVMDEAALALKAKNWLADAW